VPLRDLSFTPDAVFQKRSHSALIGSGLGCAADATWHPACHRLRHPHRTKLLDNDAPLFDLGYQVVYVTDATLNVPDD